MPDAHRSTVSVALCTFNGERFLREQLESVAAQRRPPDELVVCDDGSRDRTVEIIESFGRAAPFPVRLHVNDHRVGSTKNFEQAIARCQGALVALSDQDDVWHPDKLSDQEEVLLSSRLVAVFSDGEVVGSDLEPLGYSLWESAGFGPRERSLISAGRAHDVLVRRDVVCGATLMFDARHRGAMLPIPPGWHHDGWIALVAAALDGLGVIARPLIRYRHHGGNQVGAPRAERFAIDVGKRLATLGMATEHADALRERYRHGAERLRSLRGVDPRFAMHLEARVDHLDRRSHLPRRVAQRARVVFGELVSGRYHRYSAGLRSAGKDLVVRS
ncbi:MAG TPA: glycosyltransferase family 2 protein [Actinomycetota bacterium]|nr:glycosyltransferase family 2 protein [Actinomycetota bacterium]